jgi:hypothetical protein
LLFYSVDAALVKTGAIDLLLYGMVVALPGPEVGINGVLALSLKILNGSPTTESPQTGIQVFEAAICRELDMVETEPLTAGFGHDLNSPSSSGSGGGGLFSANISYSHVGNSAK